MVTTITTHSYKGGVGKSLFTINLGIVLAHRGFNVVVVDMDLAAPSLCTYIPVDIRREKVRINEMLLNNAEIGSAIVDLSEVIESLGAFYVVLASNDSKEIMKITRRNIKEYSDDAAKLFNWINTLKSPPYNIDFILLDTSPGLSYNSVNCIAASDISIIMTKLSRTELLGTKNMIQGLHSRLGVEIAVVVNQVPLDLLNDDALHAKVDRIMQEILGEDVTFCGIISRDDNIALQEIAPLLDPVKNDYDITQLHAVSQQQSKFTYELEQIVNFLLENQKIR